jgi:cbb3-type cytochrome oxidase subunit 3
MVNAMHNLLAAASTVALVLVGLGVWLIRYLRRRKAAPKEHGLA